MAKASVKALPSLGTVNRAKRNRTGPTKRDERFATLDGLFGDGPMGTLDIVNAEGNVRTVEAWAVKPDQLRSGDAPERTGLRGDVIAWAKDRGHAITTTMLDANTVAFYRKG